MKKKIFLLLLLILVLGFGCFDSKNNKDSQKKIEIETPKIKPIINAVDLLGKSSLEVDKTLGKPYLITGEVKSDPTIKSRYRWYKFGKDLSVFIYKDLDCIYDDSKENVASVINLQFENIPKSVEEAASFVGVNLEDKQPSSSKEIAGGKEIIFDNILVGKKKIKIYFFTSNTVNSIKVSFAESEVLCK